MSSSCRIPHWRSHFYLTASARPNAGRSSRHGQSLCAYPLGIHRERNSFATPQRPIALRVQTRVELVWFYTFSAARPKASSSESRVLLTQERFRCRFVRWSLPVKVTRRSEKRGEKLAAFGRPALPKLLFWLLTSSKFTRHGAGGVSSLRGGQQPSFQLVEVRPASVFGGRVRLDNKVTWLILPVVICLSQRLSHACLSINNFIL